MSALPYMVTLIICLQTISVAALFYAIFWLHRSQKRLEKSNDH